VFWVAEDSGDIHGPSQRDQDLLALVLWGEAGDTFSGFLKPVAKGKRVVDVVIFSRTRFPARETFMTTI
jgi:hypothetical protein